MIIGLSGKINSGKDTAVNAIQWLFAPEGERECWENNFEAFNSFWNSRPFSKGWFWQRKRFADKVKDIVCLLIGCTREQLEDREFKNKSLGEDWILYAYATGFTTDNKGNKTMLTTLCSKEKYEEERRINWQTAYKREITPRALLQLVGTECGRNILHPNVWINSLFTDYVPAIYWMCDRCGKEDIYGLKEIRPDEYVCPECKGQEREGDLTKVLTTDSTRFLIPDVRFVNEAEAILKRKGFLFRIEREGQEPSNHTSETSLDDYKGFHDTIYNNGTLPDLLTQIESTLKKHQIL